jgi:tRNA (guanine-N7-)-methyltransferase
LIEPVQAADQPPIDWLSLVGDHQPVELEIGSGKGLFLANAARARPDHNFLGVELSRKYARLAAGRLARWSIPNAKVLCADARFILANGVPTASLCAIHVYFPDPWWKKRHKKRRVFTPALTAEIERVLQVGGQLKVASDVESYLGEIRSLISAHPTFHEQPISEPGAPQHDQDYLTSFERKYRIEGRAIFRACYVLR